LKNILISGGNGTFANIVKKMCADNDSYTVFAPTKKEMNVSNYNQVENYINNTKPDYFIHAAALTKPIRIHETNSDKSILTNIIGTANVVRACMSKDIKLIYISTDHVYPGSDGRYKETDPVLPVNKYAWSKLGGECAVMMYDNSCIIRTSMTDYPFPHEFAIEDSFKSSIFINDATKIILSLLDYTGVYNVGGERMSIYDFAKKSKKDVKKIKIKEIKDVSMPKDSSMCIDKMKASI
jgi:dTDP-4-dehydrorhamnose reductase